MKKIIVVVILAGAGALAWWAWSLHGTPTVKVAVLERAETIETVSATGTVRAEQRAEVSAEIAGQLAAVLVDEGDRVAAGDTVARFVDTTLQLRVAEAESAVAAAKAALERVRTGARPEEIRQAEARVREADAELEGARDALANAEKQYENRTELRSRLDAAESALRQAEAAREAARAQLADLKGGARQQEIARAKAGVDAAAAVRAQAERDSERAQRLFREGAISRREVEQAEQALKTARANERNAQAQLDLLQAGPRQQQVEAAQAELKRAEAAVEGAEREVSNARRLFDANLRNKVSLDEARARFRRAEAAREVAVGALERLKSLPHAHDVRQAEAEVQRAQAAAELARETLAKADIRAPIDGVVVGKLAHAGEVVQPGQPIVEVSASDSLRLVLHLEEAHAARVRLNQEAKVVTDALPDRVFSGRVSFIAPRADPMQGTAEVRVEVLDDGGALRPGMTADASIVVARTSETITVSVTAVRHDERGDYVFTVVDGMARVRRMNVVSRDETNAVIEGVAAGTPVIVDPPEQLRDGDRVRVSADGDSK